MSALKSIAVFALPVLLMASPALAQDDATRAAARTLGTEGVEAYQGGDYPVAVKKLKQAYAVLSVPSLALWLGRAQARSGHLVAAAELYLEATRLPISGSQAAVQRQAQTDAETERQSLLPRIPNLVIVVRGAEADELQLDIDGVAVPIALLGAKRPTDPGTHVVTAKRGARRVTRTLTLAERATEQIELDLGNEANAPAAVPPAGPVKSEPSAAPRLASEDQVPQGSPRSTQRMLGWGALGLGGVGLVVGGIFGAVALGQKRSLDDECPDSVCPPRRYGDVDSYYRSRTVSSVGVIVGVVGVGAGVTLLLTAPRSSSASEQPKVAAWVGLDRAGLQGSF